MEGISFETGIHIIGRGMIPDHISQGLNPLVPLILSLCAHKSGHVLWRPENQEGRRLHVEGGSHRLKVI